MSRRPVVAVVGSGDAPPAVEGLANELGKLAIDADFRLVTGGLGGVMEAASRGARSSASWTEGRIVGVLPTYDRDTANRHVDIIVPTGLQIGRNIIVVAMADVVIAVAGGAGTLSELAIAWQLNKPVIALSPSGGWAQRLSGTSIDGRRASVVHDASAPAEAIALAQSLVAADRGSASPVRR